MEYIKLVQNVGHFVDIQVVYTVIVNVDLNVWDACPRVFDRE